MSAGSPASAAVLQLDAYDRSEFGAAQAAMDDFVSSHRVSNMRLETFEDFQAWNGSSGTSDPNTRVGRFSTLGGHGTGDAAINGGFATEVRDDNRMRWGRYDTDDDLGPSLGGNWLDSNDTYGMKWEIGGLGGFNALAFFLTDVADVGATFSLKVGDTVFSDLAGNAGRLANGNLHLVRILLDETVESLTVELRHDQLNDGFGIDGAMTAEIAPVPLPPAALLLLSGLAAAGGLRLRRRKAG